MGYGSRAGSKKLNRSTLGPPSIEKTPTSRFAMADPSHLALLASGINAWNAARPAAPDLLGADLRGADLRKADLRRANLREANLENADLQDAKLYRANLNRCN